MPKRAGKLAVIVGLGAIATQTGCRATCYDTGPALIDPPPQTTQQLDARLEQVDAMGKSGKITPETAAKLRENIARERAAVEKIKAKLPDETP